MHENLATSRSITPSASPASPSRAAPPSGRNPRSIGAAIVIILGVAAVVAGGVWGVIHLNSKAASVNEAEDSGKAPKDPDLHVVRRIDFEISITTSGELEAAEQVLVKNFVEGRRRISEIVNEGEFVHQGDVLVELAHDDIDKEIETARQAVAKADGDQKTAREELAIEESEADSLLKQAEVDEKLAELKLLEWRKGTLVEKKLELELAVTKAQDTLVIAERDFKEAQGLLEKGFISKSEHDDSHLKLKEAQAALEKANVAREAYLMYTMEQEKQTHTSTLEQATAALARTKLKNNSKIAAAQAKLDSAENTLALQRENLAKFEKQLALCTIKAPTDGLVVYATSVGSGRRRSNEPIQQGSEVNHNETLILLPDTTQLIATMKVNETRKPQVHPGQKVTIIIDALKSQPLEGTVDRISVMAEDSHWSTPDVREYTVRVKLPANIGVSSTNTSSTTQAGGQAGGQRSGKAGKGKGRGERKPVVAPDGRIALTPGMRCTGKIFIDRVEGALAVPVHAVFTEKRRHFVYMPEGNRFRERDVEIGRASEDYVEILGGLEENDRVLLRKPEPGEVIEEEKEE